MNETQYWNGILKSKRCIPLSRDVEKAFLLRCQAGDKRAEHRLVESNLKFVAAVANNYLNKGLEFGELMSEGAIGLQTAANRFDSTQNFKFVSYAVWWVRQRILDALAKQTRAYVMPPRFIDLHARIEKTRQKLDQTLGRPARHEEIAKALGMPESLLESALGVLSAAMSMDFPSVDGEGSGATPFVERLPSTSNSEDEAAASMVERCLEKVVEGLNPIEREAWVRGTGVDGMEKETLEEIGSRHGITRERVRQRRNQARIKVAKMARRMSV